MLANAIASNPDLSRKSVEIRVGCRPVSGVDDQKPAVFMTAIAKLNFAA
jgi:hypothetical protein